MNTPLPSYIFNGFQNATTKRRDSLSFVLSLFLFLLVSFSSFAQNADIPLGNVDADRTNASVCTTIDFLEDFGTGIGRVCDLNGATTTYTCNQTTQVDDAEYSITNISDGLNTGWHVGMEDNTPGDVDGRMLFVNADFNPGEFYRRTITLLPDTDYTFSAWITTVYDIDTGICGGTGIPSNVIFRIEDPGGTMVAETITGDIQNEADPNWQQFFINFNTGVNSDIQLVLVNNAPGGCGNDLAIDDIALSFNNVAPVLVTPADLVACDTGNDGVEIFDLTSTIPEILNGQDAADFNISFHLTQLDADTSINAIAAPDMYINTSNPQTIYVRVDNISEPSCFSTVDFDLILNTVIDLITNLPDTVALCSTDVIPQLDATPTNGGIDLSLVTYEWTDGGGNVVATTAVYTPTVAGTYTVVVTYPPCSENTFVVDLGITDAPVLDLGADQIFCDGDAVEIVPSITGNTDGIQYLWSTGETTPTIVVDASDTYSLQIIVGPCVVSDSVLLEFGELPIVTLGEDFKTCPNELQTIRATVTPSDVTYQWFLNGELITGESGSSLDITLDENVIGTQTVTVVVMDGPCAGEDSIDITLYDVGNCVISQGISPNGSTGFNDELDLEFLSDRTGIGKLQIFNRHGLLVFERNNYVNEWKGQSKDGNDLPTGTYFYVIDLLGEDPVYGAQATGWVYLNQDAN